jgi:hypothetical protein
MNSLNSAQMIMGIIISAATILSLTAAGVRWLVKHYFAELKPNGGGSLKDKVNMLEARVNEADAMRRSMDKKLDRVYDLLITYIASKDK